MNKTNIELARECQLLDGLAVVPSQVDRFAAAVEARLMAKLLEGAGEPLTPHEIGEFTGTHEYGPEELKWFRLGEAAHGIGCKA